MKKIVTTMAAALLAASTAFAGDPTGINLSWNDCGVFGQSTLSFACDANSGPPLTLVGSYVPPAGVNEFLGISAQVDVTVGPQLPDWWKHGAALCRGTTGLAVDFNFNSGPFNCTDAYFGAAAGGFAYDAEFGAASRARLRIQCAIPIDNKLALDPAQQYYAFKVNLLKSKTTGGGNCAGCLTEACIVLNSIQLFQPPEANNDPEIVTEEDQNWVTYQSASILDCPVNTPVRSRTWGQVKSLYR